MFSRNKYQNPAAIFIAAFFNEYISFRVQVFVFKGEITTTSHQNQPPLYQLAGAPGR